MVILRNRVVLYLGIITSAVFLSSSLAQAAGVLFQYKAEVGQKRRYIFTEPGVVSGTSPGGVTTIVNDAIEKIIEVDGDVYTSVITAAVIQGYEPKGYVFTSNIDPTGKHMHDKRGYNHFKGKIEGKTSSSPMSYGEIESWRIYPIFSGDPIEIGGQWGVDLYVGQDTGWFGMTGVYPVHIVYIFIGMEERNGRNCARIEFQMQGGKQEVSPNNDERYDCSTTGQGILYFDPVDGVICYYHKKVTFYNKEEDWVKKRSTGEWVWITRTNSTTTNEFTLELKAVIPPGGN
jgi:hypothetical protein